MTLVSPIPNLQYLKITDIDPLCYPDDISYLLVGCKTLRHLNLHWSPRMREACEPSTHVSAYFGKCEAAKYLLPLKSMAIQNLYTYDCCSCGDNIDYDVLEEVTCLNSTGGFGDYSRTAFMVDRWRKPAQYIPAQNILPKLRMLRIDKISRSQCDFLGSVQGLERLYLLGQTNNSSNLVQENSKDVLPSAVHTPPTSDTSSPSTTVSSGDTSNNVSASLQTLKAAYIDIIVRNHGSTLRHLLLIPQWRLTADDITLIFRQCPNLEQLGLATEFGNFDHLRLLIPFLSKLRVVRLLGYEEESSRKFVETMRELDSSGIHIEKIGQETVNREWSKLRYLELGASDMIYEIGGRYKLDDVLDSEGKEVWRRHVKKVSLEEVGDIDIWKMNSLIV